MKTNLMRIPNINLFGMIEMRRIVIMIGLIILFGVSTKGQWYYRQYGVTDIFQLNQEQFKESLNKANTGVWTGAIMSTIGIAGLISGITLTASANDMGGEGEGRAYAGVFLTIGSVPITLTGITVLGINGSRAGRIKAILKNAELEAVLINCCQQPILNCSYYGITRVPALTISIHF